MNGKKLAHIPEAHAVSKCRETKAKNVTRLKNKQTAGIPAKFSLG